MPLSDASSLPPMSQENDPKVGQDAPIPEGEPNEEIPQEPQMNEKTQEVVDIMNQSDEEGQKTILKYARSVKDEKGGSDNDNEEGAPMDDNSMPPMDDANMPPQQPMQESFIFSKKQLRLIREGFEDMNGEEERKTNGVKPTTKTKNSSKKQVKPTDPPRRY